MFLAIAAASIFNQLCNIVCNICLNGYRAFPFPAVDRPGTE